MRKISLIMVCIVLFITCIESSHAQQKNIEKVGILAAKRAAEYYGNLIFEKELQVCDKELMYWPWGEPAVYVFILTEDISAYPSSILLDQNIIRGAFYVKAGNEEEGYFLMAQAEKYYTIVIGATVDMPPLIKAYAGLPEHIIALALMEVPPIEPHWIFGGLFRTYLDDKLNTQVKEGANLIEIHTNNAYSIEELGNIKKIPIPNEEIMAEWNRFRLGDVVFVPVSDTLTIPDVNEGTHIIREDDGKPLKEVAFAGSKGCSPAAFVNCLWYLKGKGKIDTQGKKVRELINWAAVCFRTYEDGNTGPSWIKKGAEIMFRGLGYKSKVSEVYLYTAAEYTWWPFLRSYAKEIYNNLPCEVGGWQVSGTGIFKNHSTTGIGYKKVGDKIQLIVHDGWRHTTQEVYTNYNGWEFSESDIPNSMTRFHPKKMREFIEANPIFELREKVYLNEAKNEWRWKTKISSDNNIDVECYAYKMKFYKNKGGPYYIEEWGELPYANKFVHKFSKPPIKRGKCEITYYLIDGNGHLLSHSFIIKLSEPRMVGSWQVNYRHTVWEPGYWQVSTLILKKNGTCIQKGQDSDGWPWKMYGLWELNGNVFEYYWQTYDGPPPHGKPIQAVFQGKVNKNLNKIRNGIGFTRRPNGSIEPKDYITWNAVKIEDNN